MIDDSENQPNNVSPSAGNQAVIERQNAEDVQIRNDTCAEFYLRVVAKAEVGGILRCGGCPIALAGKQDSTLIPSRSSLPGRPSTKGRNFVPGFGTHETKSSTEGK